MSPSCFVSETQDSTTWHLSQYTGSPVATLSIWSRSFMETKITLVSVFLHLMVFVHFLARVLTGGADARLFGIPLCCCCCCWIGKSSVVVDLRLHDLPQVNIPLREDMKLRTLDCLLDLFRLPELPAPRTKHLSKVFVIFHSIRGDSMNLL